MHYEHSIRRLENAYMDSPEMSFTRFQPEDIILHRLRIRRGKIELKILEKLSRREANVYELRWKRLRDVNVHYSTVLRALERLEKKKLVKIISSSKVGRRYKTYANTLSGDLVLALAKKGLDGTAKILAENSPSFRECLGAHSSLGQDHYMFLTREVVWEISMGKKGNVITHHDLDFYVRKAELLWIRRNVIDVLKDHSFRPEIVRYLKKIAHINWISDSIMKAIERYAKEENEWLQTLEDFKRDVKLTKLYVKTWNS